MTGALAGVRVVEFAGQGPGPFCGGLLADFGADVVVIDRPDRQPDTPRAFDFYMRNKRSIAVDLKSAEGHAQALALIGRADLLIEGYRPGVMERLGLGPLQAQGVNPPLVYGRMTGWGQTGPMAQEAGHDINYLALTGALHAIGPEGTPPPPPLNLVADLGGGALYLAFGLMAALHVARSTGKGQVVDAAMIDGVSHLMSAFQAFRQQGSWTGRRGDNIVDGGAPWYGTYACADGRFVAVGAMEPQFYAAFVAAIGLDIADLPPRDDRANWPALRALFAARLATRSRDDWAAHMAGRDACFSAVLSIDEAWDHPQMTARGAFQPMGGLRHPAPAPRLSATPGALRHPAPEPGANTAAVLRDWGLSGETP
jgi:alpha-methylacyl-CoA racemase